MTTADMREGITIKRTFDAPRERIWRAWTEPEEFKRWWGSREHTIPMCKIDLRVGGTYLYCMRSPEGQDFYATGEYREIVPQERLVFTDSFADEEGNRMSPTQNGMDASFPDELLISVRFEDLGSKTTITLRHSGLPAGEDGEMTGEGWRQSFDKLAEAVERGESASVRPGDVYTTSVTLPGDREVLVQRVFDAPRALVWKAYTDPKLIPQWWGPGYLTTKVEEMDVRPGGRWRYVQRDPDGHEYAFHGEYREVAPPERLASTFIFEGQPGESSLDIATFEEVDGKTRLTVRSVFDSAGGRDGMYAEGMEEGMIEGYDRLSALLREQQTQPRLA